MGTDDWHTRLKLREWVTVDACAVGQLVDVCLQDVCFVYVDWTCESTPRPFYVGKGSRGRVNTLYRNVEHEQATQQHGCKRVIVAAYASETEAFEHEVCLIASLKTYRYGGEGWWGANKTVGGDGASGSKRPEAARLAACLPVKQLTLGGELLAVFPSVKAAKLAVPGSNVVRCCQGHLWQSKGYRWEYVEPNRAATRTDACRANMHASAPKRAVVQLSPDGRVMATFASARYAAQATGVGEDNVRRVCYERRGTAGGFGWCYADLLPTYLREGQRLRAEEAGLGSS